MAKANSQESALRKALEVLSPDDELGDQIRTRLEEMNRLTAEGIWKLVDEACAKEAELTRAGNRTRVVELQEFTRSIAIAQEFLRAFRKNPRIHGANGVANALHLSRHGVYVRLSSVGLDHNQITNKSDIASLVAASTILSELTERAKKILRRLKNEEKTKKQ